MANIKIMAPIPCIFWAEFFRVTAAISVPENTDSFICQDFRRAYAENTPQPPPQGPSTAVEDISLLGMIGPDGHVFGLKAINQARPDLNDEAIKLVSTWTFAPATCGGKPVAWQATFTIHFRGR